MLGPWKKRYDQPRQCIQKQKHHFVNKGPYSQRDGFSSEWVSEVAQSCLTLCNPMDCSLPSSSVHGIFQAIVLEWIAISFSRGSSWTRDQTWVSRIVDRRFTAWATREVQWFTNINESPGKFVNVQNAGPHPQRFLILETCPWICMSNKFPRDSDAAVLGITV